MAHIARFWANRYIGTLEVTVVGGRTLDVSLHSLEDRPAKRRVIERRSLSNVFLPFPRGEGDTGDGACTKESLRQADDRSRGARLRRRVQNGVGPVCRQVSFAP